MPERRKCVKQKLSPTTCAVPSRALSTKHGTFRTLERTELDYGVELDRRGATNCLRLGRNNQGTLSQRSFESCPRYGYTQS